MRFYVLTSGKAVCVEIPGFVVKSKKIMYTILGRMTITFIDTIVQVRYLGAGNEYALVFFSFSEKYPFMQRSNMQDGACARA